MTKQLNFLSDTNSSSQEKKVHQWKLYIDGASKNNPGPSGAGFCLFKDDVLVVQHGFFLGAMTNNQAEYYALLLGLFFGTRYVQPADSLRIISDSQLLVRQLLGEYKTTNSMLKQFQVVVRDLLCKYTHYEFMHVLRHLNTHADAMANEGVEKRINMPQEFITFLRTYGITT